jgi:hypothetical protein
MKSRPGCYSPLRWRSQRLGSSAVAGENGRAASTLAAYLAQAPPGQLRNWRGWVEQAVVHAVPGREVLLVVRCWVCGGEGEGLCRFCGRGVCKEHARTRAFLFEAWDQAGTLRGLAVEDALHCGVCKVRPDPVDVEFLRKGEPPA